ncbi:MAG TPA: FAD/NAD(P)-binding protein [Myxococcaceae bacterium]|nr:FAD/NAD(P)-binding protein [Myxococcaceae bacterium]
MTDGVVIVGGGASGTLTAVALAGVPGLGPLMLVDAGGAFARGVAYSTEEPVHLLNVPAGRMSAFPDQPSHLLDWLAARGEPADPEAFIQRRLYGAYLGELLHGTGTRVRRVVDRALSLAAHGPGLQVALALGPPLQARAAVLALGNFPPELPPGWTELPPRLAWRTPWCTPEDWPAPDTEVLLVGAGLTAVDVVLSLDARGHRGRIHLLSRRGLAPATHPARMFAPLALGPRPAGLRPLLRMFRERARREDPRAVLDTLRPELGALWQGLSPVEQRRFLRHLRTWFDTLRHRVAPEVGARVGALEAEGRLVRHAGRAVSITEQGGRLALRYRPRGARTLAVLAVDLAIPTTGPAMDVRALDDPLVRSLLAAGQARPGPHGLGFATAEDGAVLGPLGDRLWTLGGLRRGDLWESTAIPEIRAQAQALGGTLAARLRTAGAGSGPRPGRC